MIPIKKDLLERLRINTVILLDMWEHSTHSELRKSGPIRNLTADLAEIDALLSQHNNETDKNEGE